MQEREQTGRFMKKIDDVEEGIEKTAGIQIMGYIFVTMHNLLKN